MANTKKRRKLIVFSLIGIVLVGLTIYAVLAKREAVITIQKEKTAHRNITELVVANGKIQPVLQVKISPEVSGEIIDLPVKEGQKVKKGDLLVKIRPDNYLATRNSSLANYKYSLANSNNSAASLEKAGLEYKRNEELYKAKLISDSDFLTAKTTFDVAKAMLEGAAEQVDVARASLQSAETDLSKTTIYSPLDGTISKLNSQLGERVVGTAMMAGTEIMTVADLNEMEARVDIGEIDVVLIAVGQIARLEVDAFKDQKFKGIVTEIANSAKNNDASSAAASSSTTQDATKFQVKIRIQEKELFLPGMSVTAEIETRSRTNVLAIPIQSVTTRLPKGATNLTMLAANDPPPHRASDDPKPSDKKKAGEAPKPVEVVFVVNGDHVKMVPVKRGISDDDYVEITDGLKEGDEVVSGGYKAISRELEEGKKVLVGPAKSEIVAEKK
ncbi:MAG TPA: efflux RND transporter periplasmic adaptor subunit [Verrucomicrobiae bacterium]|jgi:HlyD family secretion protein|nr:efflux RND transporter periplasmic adaptor subunit [Verrucomicrobiae bacterium]